MLTPIRDLPIDPIESIFTDYIAVCPETGANLSRGTTTYTLLLPDEFDGGDLLKHRSWTHRSQLKAFNHREAIEIGNQRLVRLVKKQAKEKQSS
jgi:hypothetical protein